MNHWDRPTPTIRTTPPKPMNPTRQPYTFTTQPARGAKTIVAAPTPTEAAPMAFPRLRMNHLPTDELQTTTPKQAPPNPPQIPYVI